MADGRGFTSMMRTSRMSPGSAPRTIDRAGADMHAQALASAAAKELAVDWAGAAAIDAFFLLGPEIDAFGTRVAFDHALGIVIGVMRQCLDRDVVARIHLDLRLEELAEITPVHRLGSRRKIVMAGLALPGAAVCAAAGATNAARRR